MNLYTEGFFLQQCLIDTYLLLCGNEILSLGLDCKTFAIVHKFIDRTGSKKSHGEW